MTEKKAFEASPRKLREARKQGQILKSPILIFAISLSLFTIMAIFLIRFSWLRFQILLEYLLVWGYSNPALSLRMSVILTYELLFPTLLLVGFVGFLFELFLVGPSWHLMRGVGFNLVKGSRKIVKGFCTVPVIGVQVFCVMTLLSCLLWKNFLPAEYASLGSEQEVLAACRRLALNTWAPLCMFLLFLGVLEYLMKRRKYLAELSMSFDELRQEIKEEEGDPHVKAMRQQLQRALAYEELVARVRASKVLIVERR